ncbi:MAG: type II toxin-antitoxin system VapC family toxin [Pseudomonadota bacterium]
MIWLLDTNTIIYALKYQGGVRERINLAGLRGEELVTSAVVAAELLSGAERSARRDENRKEVHKALFVEGEAEGQNRSFWPPQLRWMSGPRW